MALVVVPSANADSYLSVADADTYHAGRPSAAAWAALANPAKESALRVASEYIDIFYEKRFLGQRTSPAQPFAWPRAKVFVYGASVSIDDSTVPVAIKSATAYLALQSTLFDLTANIGPSIKREKIGPIETEYSVAANGSQNKLIAFPYVGGLLRDYMRPAFSLTVDRG